jgi:hypothetical protein
MKALYDEHERIPSRRSRVRQFAQRPIAFVDLLCTTTTVSVPHFNRRLPYNYVSQQAEGCTELARFGWFAQLLLKLGSRPPFAGN